MINGKIIQVFLIDKEKRQNGIFKDEDYLPGDFDKIQLPKAKTDTYLLKNSSLDDPIKTIEDKKLIEEALGYNVEGEKDSEIKNSKILLGGFFGQRIIEEYFFENNYLHSPTISSYDSTGEGIVTRYPITHKSYDKNDVLIYEVKFYSPLRIKENRLSIRKNQLDKVCGADLFFWVTQPNKEYF